MQRIVNLTECKYVGRFLLTCTMLDQESIRRLCVLSFTPPDGKYTWHRFNFDVDIERVTWTAEYD